MKNNEQYQKMLDAVKKLVETCGEYSAKVCNNECPIRKICISRLKEFDDEPYFWDFE